MTAILYSFRRCPYAMRGRMALSAAGIEYEHREVLLRNKPDEMLEASAKGTVPVFIKEGGEVIDESLDVMYWALAQNDSEGWLDTDMSAASALIAQNDGDFKHHLDRYKYKSRYDDTAKRGDVDLDHRAQAMKIVGGYETALTGNAGLLGKTSLADIAIFPFMRQFAATQPEWWAAQSQAPRVRDWLTRHIESPRFKTIMTKYPLWTPA